MALVGCAQEGGNSDRATAMTTANADRIVEFLEAKIMPESEGVVCAFEQWAQPAGNVIEGWALCADANGTTVSTGAKVWFANPSLLILPDDTGNFSTSVWKNFTKESARKIFKNEFDRESLEAQLVARQAMPDVEVVEIEGVGGTH